MNIRETDGKSMLKHLLENALEVVLVHLPAFFFLEGWTEERQTLKNADAAHGRSGIFANKKIHLLYCLY